MYQEVTKIKEDFAEYTKCPTCNNALINCGCACPYCGKRDKCKCELMPIRRS